MAFKKATKYESKARIGIAGPSGSGKTYTSLILAFGLGSKVALIDTERGSASKYADLFGEFDVMELDTFHPDKFIQGIHEAEEAGYEVLIIDSLSHAWNGPGGLLEIVENISKRSKSANSFASWSEATPLQNKLVDAITRSKLHIICTMRSKQEYVLEKNDQGKTIPRKVGMAPIQRQDFEYEFDIFAEMDYDNNLIVQKTRCPALAGAVVPKPDARIATVIKDWLAGETPPAQSVQEEPQATKDALTPAFHQLVEVGILDESEQGWLKFCKLIVGWLKLANIKSSQQLLETLTASQVEMVKNHVMAEVQKAA